MMKQFYTQKNRLIFLFVLALGFSLQAQQLSTYEDGVLKGVIKVKVRPELVTAPQGLAIHSYDGIAQIGVSSIDKLNTEYKAVKMERIFPYSPKFETRHQKHGLHLWYRIEVDNKLDIQEVIKTYGLAEDILIAEPYYEKQLIPYTITEMQSSTAEALKASAELPYNDPLLIDQWHYNNLGNGNTLEGADINLYAAWEKQSGKPDVIVSIHDEGIDVTHEDIADNMWVNEAELNGTEGVDDDGNGYIDDIYGYNFSSNTGKIDPMHHGTHVAGTVAAVNNNGIGVSGVAGGTGNEDGVRIMSCQIIGGDGSPDVAASYVYAADMGAVISQNSWGWLTDGEYEQSVLDAIDYFIEEAGNYPESPMKGGIAIFAAGNTGNEGKHYPAYYESTISVASTGPTNLLTDYSNYGASVDISAPGGDNTFGSEYGVLSTIAYNGYAYLDGTSMACPHVSGVAALIASEFGSETFTAEDMKTHLLGGTAVLDTIADNIVYEGKMGVGGADAELALRSDNGLPPNQITDLELLGISQDFANLKWTVPADVDDDKPSTFEICYSTEDFDDSTVDIAQKVRIRNISEVGENVEYELVGLKSLTAYYFAVRGIDRWGNTAPLSNKINATTNAGPEVDFSTESISFNIDVNIDSTATTSFILKNIGEGVLKWEAYSRHVKNIDTYSLTDPVSYPAVYSVPKQPVLISSPVADVEVTSTIVPYAQKPVEDDDLFYFDESYLSISMTTIGETDTKYTNSSATRFELTRDEGFNMTHLEFALYLPELPLANPVILEIYKGDEIASAKKIYAQEYYPEDLKLWHFVEMNEQLFFNKGDVFWFVIHIPSNHMFPLVASVARYSGFSDFCYYSNSMGNTWDKLSDIYTRDDYVWDIAVWSQFEPLDRYMKLTPDNGILPAISDEIIEVELDASDLINGDYDAKIAFLTNETGSEIAYMPAKISVTGHNPIIESENIIEYGNVFVSESKALSVELYNSGLGAFAGIDNSSLDVTISNPDFQISNTAPRVIYAQRSEILTFRYSPTKAGASNALVTITDKLGNKHKFNLFAVGINPPLASVSPVDTTYSDLNLGDILNGSFTLSNEGEYPLEYYIPKFADGANLGVDNINVHLFGYAGGEVEGDEITNAFDWVDISTTGTEVGNRFVSNSKVKFIDIPLDFSFPFFDSVEDTVYITKQGALSFSTDGWFNSTPVMFGNQTQPGKLISAIGLPFDLVRGGSIYYQKYPGKLVVQYDDIFRGYLDDDFNYNTTNITFQIVIFDNGDIEIYYKDLGTIPYGSTILGLRTTMQVSIYDKEMQDGLLLNGFVSPDISVPGDYYTLKSDMPPTTGYMMYFRYPGLGSVKSVTNPYGTVQVGESIQIDYTIDTKDLFVYDFTERINVISNDPVNNPVVHNINLNIVSGGSPVYDFSVDTIMFGNVFQRDSVTKKLIVSNSGKAVAKITDITFQNGNYSYEGYMPVELKPGSRVEYNITINSADMGNKDDMMLITDSLGQTFNIPVIATVVEAPIISTEITAITETLNYGTTKTVNLAVDNTGKNSMLVSPVGNEWLQILKSGTQGNSADVDYHVTFEQDPSSVYSNWLDITNSGVKLPNGDMFDNKLFWRTQEIPFKFPYYGELHDTLYIGYNGIVSMVGSDVAYSFGPETLIPDVEDPNNFIAPLWGPIGPDYIEIYPNAGTYYQEFDDKVVIMFRDYINVFSMGYPVSFEVILYKNGLIKFIYYFPYDEYTTKWCVAGIENGDGIKGHAPSQFVQGLIKDGSVMTFVPVEQYEVAANSSVNFDVTLNAKSVYGGLYEDDLQLSNNTPDAPDYSIPVSLTVVGEKIMVAEDTLNLGELFIYEEIIEDGITKQKQYDFNFTLSNNGTEKINISRVILQGRTSGFIVMGDQDKFGTVGAEDPWVDISRKKLNFDLKPQNSETFNLRVIPVNQAIVADTILVICDIEGDVFKLPVSANLINPPIVNIQTDSISVFTNSEDEIVTRKAVIDNINGAADLTYEIEIQFERNKTETSVNSMATPETSSLTQELAPDMVTVTNLKATTKNNLDRDIYNRILEYDTEETPAGMIGFGGSADFFTATSFFAPANGFNLTHVMSWIGWDKPIDSTIEIQIYGGADIIQNADLLHSEYFAFTEPEANTNGEFKTFELSTNLLFYPNEKFFVVFHYTKDFAYPQGYVAVEPVSDRYYFGNAEQMFELVEAGYGDTGWMMKAAEKSFTSNIWLNVLSGKTDTIPMGGQKEIDLSFIAEYANKGVNIASMIVHSNDPVTPETSMKATLTRNKGPQFTDGSGIYYAISEIDTLTHKVVAFHENGDDFTLKLQEEYKYVTAVVNGHEMDITFTPDYDGAGFHTIIVVGTDIHGNESTFKLDISVQDVNRAPIEIHEIENQYYVLENEDGYILKLDEYIIDPDGDEVIFSIEWNDPNILDVFQSGPGLVMMPLDVGTGAMKITATDSYGAQLETGFHIFIDHRTGINKNEISNLLIYPNPVRDELSIRVDDEISSDITVRITGFDGKLIQIVNVSEFGKQMTINVSSLTPGLYFIEVESDKKTYIEKFTKK